jgi:phosphoribosylamine--glycine ligase
VEAALAALQEMMADFRFGEAGREVVVEECMKGEELSVFAITDGDNLLTLVPSQDHKAIGEGDRGENTGGMGAYAPVSIATPDLHEQVRQEVLLPTLQALAREGSPFRGLLYAGLMLTEEGPRVVEFNCRFGDPETQVVLPLLKGSLLDPLAQVAEGGSIASMELRTHSGCAVTTVLASAGYPGAYEKGKAIRVPAPLEEDENVVLFHAGTKQEAETLTTAGGRVLAVTGLGETLWDAAQRSRSGADQVEFEGKYYRKDIGWREFARDEGSRP